MKELQGKIDDIQKIYTEMQGNYNVSVHNYKFDILCIYAKIFLKNINITCLNIMFIHYLCKNYKS